MHTTPALLTAAFALALGGCSTTNPPPPLVSGASGAAAIRLITLGDRLTTAAAPLCRASLGLVDVAAVAGQPAKQRCKVMIELVPHPGIGAAADGATLMISAGMLGFVRNDDELAAVIAHRLAHQIADWPPASTEPLVSLSPWPPRQPEPVFDPARERAADRISLFVLARAGIDPAVAVAFWRRLQSLPPDANDWLMRHPVTPARLEAMAGIVTEIGLLREAHQALLP